MELRSVDPRKIKPNPDNPRKIAPDPMSDEALLASIRTIGILQPPLVREKGDALVIIAGERRVKAAIAAELAEIAVLVRDADDDANDDADDMRSLSENVVRAPMSNVDLWRGIEALASHNWTEEAIATALAVPVRQVKKLRLLANVHPAILDQVGLGDMPKEEYLRTIASASAEEQAGVWKKHKPKKGQPAVWWEVARALEKRRIPAKVAKFGPDEEQAFGVVWHEDLFEQADEDNRYTSDVEAFFAAQRAWLDANLPKNGVTLDLNDYEQPKLPPKAERIWTKPKKSDHIGFYISPRSGEITEIAFRLPKDEPKAGQADETTAGGPSTSAKPKARPEITQNGLAIIGDLRTGALATGLAQNEIDDATLIGLLALSLTAQNVSIRTNGSTSNTRTKLAQAITPGGRLTQDITLLRRVAREILAGMLSCRPGMNDSGLVARIAGDAIGADVHLPTMATEEFLSCLSKPAIEKAAASLGVLPRPRAKDTRAELIKQAAGSSFVHPAARFALSEDEIDRHLEPARSYSWGQDDDDNGDAGDSSSIEPDPNEGAPAAGDASYASDDPTDEDASGHDVFEHEDEGKADGDGDEEFRAVANHPDDIRSGAAG